ncbi:GPI mannosyltransferase 3 [Plasmodium gonderi]|uniref:Mannosyltransferase n=1 Tax=Plasmodium gonderi TaxID=77519 RepID=A0A1Y1JI15_PLAGO|nr:GPI mannosyltransferase 3 [Plasmodium gonderi]GAW82159.1 GPI mannosyltransferase 3 [Plasmodium gonderi]
MIYDNFLKYGNDMVKKCINSKRCMLYLTLFRLFNCLLVQTSFFPDEYAQSIEISHYWVFGYGHKPWEWEPCISLRSVMHPIIYAILFYFLKITKLDTPNAVLYAPRIFQGLCAALGDYGIVKLVILWYSELHKNGIAGNKSDNEKNGKSDKNIIEKQGEECSSVIYTILICYFICWFHFYTICRTSSHSFEYILNIWGVYFISNNYRPQIIVKGKRINNNSNENLIDGNNLRKGDSDFVQSCVIYRKQLAQECHKRNNKEEQKTRNSTDNNEALLYSHFVSVGNIRDSPQVVMKEGISKLSCDDFKMDPYNNTEKLSKLKIVHMQNLLLSLLCSSFCVLIRPNAALFWICIYILYLLQSRIKNNNVILSFEEVFIIGILYTIIFLLISIGIDSYYYNKITISFLNFFLYNFLSGENNYFGENPIHFYFSCVIPSIYLAFTPFTYYSFIDFVKNITRKRTSVLHVFLSRIDHIVYLATLLEVLSLSFSVHKEHKLLIGYIPFITIFTGVSLHKFWIYIQEPCYSQHVNIANGKDDRVYTNDGMEEKKKKKKKNFLLLNIGFLLHIICIVFFSRIHNSSPEKVATYFRNLKTDNDKDITILITDCYDTPLYSHIHRKFKIGFLDCSPHIKKANGNVLHNWRKRIYDNQFGNVFYDIFDINKRTSDTLEPYIIPEKSFHWFGHKNFNIRKHFEFIYEKINFTCLYYRFSIPLNGDLPLYLVTTSEHLAHLKPFLTKFNYRLEVDPIFSHFSLVKQGTKLGVVNHLIFKRYYETVQVP